MRHFRRHADGFAQRGVRVNRFADVHRIGAESASSEAASRDVPTLSGEAFAIMINLSGRRRFMSQRVVLYNVLAAGCHAGASSVAHEALELFRDAHHALIHGNTMLPGVFGAPLHDATLALLIGVNYPGRWKRGVKLVAQLVERAFRWAEASPC